MEFSTGRTLLLHALLLELCVILLPCHLAMYCASERWYLGDKVLGTRAGMTSIVHVWLIAGVLDCIDPAVTTCVNTSSS